MSGAIVAFPNRVTPLLRLVRDYLAPSEISIEDFEALEFEPDPDTGLMIADFSQDRWNQEWRCDGTHGAWLRVTATILSKTKEELVEAAEGMGEPALAEIVACLNQTRERFEALASLLRSVASRQMCAAAGVALREMQAREARP